MEKEAMRAGLDAYRRGQRDMLAKCIAQLNGLETDMGNWSSEETNAVTEVVPDLTFGEWLWAQRGVRRSVQVLRALQEKP
jgi:hypothetical protein